jgi:hypothetical protein
LWQATSLERDGHRQPVTAAALLGGERDQQAEDLVHKAGTKRQHRSSIRVAVQALGRQSGDPHFHDLGEGHAHPSLACSRSATKKEPLLGDG